MNPLLPGAPMPDENPSTDFFVYLKKKGFSTTKTSPVLVKEKKQSPLKMRSYSMHAPKYTFRQESPSLTPVLSAPLASPVAKATSKTLIFLRVLLLIILAAQSVGLYYIYKNIKDLDDAKKQVPHDLIILRDIVIVSTALVAFSLVVSFFF